MNYSDLLHLIEECKKNIEERMKTATDANAMRMYNELIRRFETDQIKLKTNISQETFDKMLKDYKTLHKMLKKKNYETKAMASVKTKEETKKEETKIKPIKTAITPKKDIKSSESHKVIDVEATEVKDDEYLKVSKEKIKRFFKDLGIAALAAVIVLSAKSCKDRKETTAGTIETTIETLEENATQETVETQSLINTLDMTNDEDVLTLANNISANYETGLSIDEIVSAIKLLNLDMREDLGGFASKEDVLKSTMDAGSLVLTCGSDEVIAKDATQDIYVSEDVLNDILVNVTGSSLSVSNFSDAKTENGTYDIYKLCEICTRGMYSNDNAFNYAKTYNDIVARFEYNFSICSESPIATLCAVTGMYNTTMEKTNELTAGQNLSTIYGNNILNDGTYGAICVEELTKFLQIYNNDGVYSISDESIYSLIVDDQIINKAAVLN